MRRYVRDGGLRGKRRNVRSPHFEVVGPRYLGLCDEVTQGLIKCEELLPHAENPNYGALTL